MNPIDLLPVVRPLEDPNPPDGTYFYNNVIKYLIPDIIKMESNGIPINLDKVAEVQNTVDTVLENVKNKLASNKLMLDFLSNKDNIAKQTKINALNEKLKTPEDFLKPFNNKNKMHRTYVINEFLKETHREDMLLEEWSVKDVKKLNQIIASNFISNLLDNSIKDYMVPTIDKAMYTLATTKAEIYNKNKIKSKIESLDEVKLIDKFNPGSSTQKQEFFKFYGIESDKETKAGNPQWDRDALEELQKLLKTMIEDKE